MNGLGGFRPCLTSELGRKCHGARIGNSVGGDRIAEIIETD